MNRTPSKRLRFTLIQTLCAKIRILSYPVVKNMLYFTLQSPDNNVSSQIPEIRTTMNPSELSYEPIQAFSTHNYYHKKNA